MREEMKETDLLPAWKEVIDVFNPPNEVIHQMSALPVDTQEVIYESFIECGKDDMILLLMCHKVNVLNEMEQRESVNKRGYGANDI